MIYLVIHPITGEHFEFADDLDAARAKKREVRVSVIASEMHRFTAVREIISGEDVTWAPVNLDEETLDGQFRVFNTFTGQHEPFETLAEARDRRQQLIDGFANDLGLNDEPIDKEELERAMANAHLETKNIQSMRDAAVLNVTRLGE